MRARRTVTLLYELDRDPPVKVRVSGSFFPADGPSWNCPPEDACDEGDEVEIESVTTEDGVPVETTEEEDNILWDALCWQAGR